MPSASLARSKQSKNTPLVRTPISADDSATGDRVTVVDPRHPLFGQTFRLIAMTPWRRTETCCVVWLQNDGIERLIPLSATDRALEPVSIFPTVIDTRSIARLACAFAGILTAEVVKEDDKRKTTVQLRRQPDATDPKQLAKRLWPLLSPAQQQEVCRVIVRVCCQVANDAMRAGPVDLAPVQPASSQTAGAVSNE